MKQNHKEGRVDGRNSTHKSGVDSFLPKKIKHEIEKLLFEHKERAAKKKKAVGQRTQDKRRSVILGFYSDLWKLKYKVESVFAIKEKHLHAVFRFLEEQGQSPSTLQNKLSIMRVFCRWIGKDGMVKDSSTYVKDPMSVHRSMVARESKSWVSKGIKVQDLIDRVREKDKYVAIILELSQAFGLRVQEAISLRPLRDYRDDHLYVRDGTKGGRPRIIKVENDKQRDVINRAVILSDKRTGMVWAAKSDKLEQKRNRFYYVLKCFGITAAKEGITAHGLRHQYVYECFERMLGIKPPVDGGDLRDVEKDKFEQTSLNIMERIGHSRTSIGASYYGGRRMPASADKAPDAVTDGAEK